MHGHGHGHGAAVVVTSAFQDHSTMATVDYLPAADSVAADDKTTKQPQKPASRRCGDDDDNDTAIIMPDDDDTTTTIRTHKTKRLEGKVAIVTGGARGIGEAIVRLFVEHGARVVIADIDDAAGQALASSLQLQAQGACSYERCDVSVEADVERAVRRAVARHGRLDVLCNNAGVLVGRQTSNSNSILSLDAAEFERVVRVNALGAALGMKHAAAAMLAQGPVAAGGGSIVSVASVAGVMGGMGPHAYTASKHALVGLTKNAACELGRHGIRVNCISPFGVATPMLLDASWGGDDGPAAESSSAAETTAADKQHAVEELVRGLGNLKHGATLRAEDIAEAALFLASDDSSYVSGHNLVVDGGVTTARNLVGL